MTCTSARPSAVRSRLRVPRVVSQDRFLTVAIAHRLLGVVAIDVHRPVLLCRFGCAGLPEVDSVCTLRMWPTLTLQEVNLLFLVVWVLRQVLDLRLLKACLRGNMEQNAAIGSLILGTTVPSPSIKDEHASIRHSELRRSVFIVCANLDLQTVWVNGEQRCRTICVGLCEICVVPLCLDRNCVKQPTSPDDHWAYLSLFVVASHLVALWMRDNQLLYLCIDVDVLVARHHARSTQHHGFQALVVLLLASIVDLGVFQYVGVERPVHLLGRSCGDNVQADEATFW